MPRDSKEEDLISMVYKLVLESGDGGILQSELWKKLSLTSRDGSRIATRLEKRKLIKREKVLEEGRWTYRLKSLVVPLSLESIADAPCITCPLYYKCYEDGAVSPRTCTKIERWVVTEYQRAINVNSISVGEINEAR
ncbi:MAG: hypothetical protein QXY52_00960 [Conexivisphaerales archaeon]